MVSSLDYVLYVHWSNNSILHGNPFVEIWHGDCSRGHFETINCLFDTKWYKYSLKSIDGNPNQMGILKLQ